MAKVTVEYRPLPGGKKVAIVTIDRPEALNALSWPMLQQLAAAFKDIGAFPPPPQLSSLATRRSFFALN